MSRSRRCVRAARIWVEDAGSAALDARSLREAYALAATDTQLIGAWFSLDFSHQHVHAVREHPLADFKPAVAPGLAVRPQARR